MSFCELHEFNLWGAPTLLVEQIWRVSAGVYQLRVFNNMFVSAMKGGGGTVLATAANPSTWETFHIIRNQANPSMVHIQANNGMYLQVWTIEDLYSMQSGTGIRFISFSSASRSVQ